MIALFGWEAMTAAERFAAVGGAAGFLSVIVSIYIAWQNRNSLAEQLRISAEANETAKLSVENQKRANEITKISVDDQVAMNQLARSASVRIAEIAMSSQQLAARNGMLGSIDWINSVPEDFSILTITLINEGRGAANRVGLIPVSISEGMLTEHHNAGWRLPPEEGGSIWDAAEPFASSPVGSILSIPPGTVVEFNVALHWAAFSLSAKGRVFGATYRLFYEDGLGEYAKVFHLFVDGIGVESKARGSAEEDGGRYLPPTQA